MIQKAVFSIEPTLIEKLSIIPVHYLFVSSDWHKITHFCSLLYVLQMFQSDKPYTTEHNNTPMPDFLQHAAEKNLKE